MRLVYYADFFWPSIGGLEVESAMLLPALRDRGYEITVVVAMRDPSLPEADQFQGIPIHRFGMSDSLRDGKLTRFLEERSAFRELWRRLEPEIAHVEVGGPSVVGLDAALRAHKPPLVVRVANRVGYAESGPFSAYQRAFDAANSIVAVSQGIRAHLVELAPELAERITVIPHGVEIPLDDPRPPSLVPPVIAAAGRIVDDKGFDLLLDAFPAVLQRHPEARLVVAGDGPEVEPLRARANRLGIGGVVEFPGWVAPERIWDLLGNASIVVVPSRWLEGLPIMAIQAALAGRAIIVTRTGGLPEAVADGETGVVVEPEDPEAIAKAILDLLAQPEALIEMGRRGAIWAQEQFGLKRAVDAYDDLYRRLGTVAPVGEKQ
jgi:glycogen synthase